MIYICIPAHNEEQTVGVVLWKIRQVMAEYPRDYQLLVVDDASTDRTPEVLAPYARVLPLTVVRTDSRQGEGAALEMMLREAVRRSEYPKRDMAITLQADFTQEPDELVGLIKRMEAGADIVAGETAGNPAAPLLARWARRLALRVLGHRRVPAGVSDPFTGYRAYRVSVLKGALADRDGRLVHWSSWAGAAELLLATAPHARRIDTVELVERRERLQRPSRQRPWRALRDVWSLTREARPLQMASPDELDQAMRSVAAVRTSEVPARGAPRPERSERTQRAERGRGTSEERRGREPGRGQQRGATPPPAGRAARAERPPRAAGERGRGRGEAAGAGEAGRGPGAGRGEARKGRHRAETGSAPVEAAAVAAEPGTEAPVVVENGASPTAGQAAEKARRKRPRRRKRGSAAGEAKAAVEGAGSADVDATVGLEILLGPIPPDGTPAEAGEPGRETAEFGAGGGVAAESDEDGADGAEAPDGEGGDAGSAASAERSRRRRRGRRGGRRRSAAAAEAGESSIAGADSASAPVREAEDTRPADSAVASSPVAQAEPRRVTPEQVGIFELIEGDRGNDA